MEGVYLLKHLIGGVYVLNESAFEQIGWINDRVIHSLKG